MTAGEHDGPLAPAVVVHGDATPEELAALVAVLSAASATPAGDQAAADGSRSTWATHSAAMRHPVPHGPGAWRTALRP